MYILSERNGLERVFHERIDINRSQYSSLVFVLSGFMGEADRFSDAIASPFLK